MRQYEPRYHSRRSTSRARRRANDPFIGRLGLMAFLFVLLVPVAMILRTDGKRHVSTNGLPGAAAVIEPGAETTATVAAAVTTAAPATAAVTYPVIDPATGRPVAPTVAATASAAARSGSASGSGSAGSSGQQTKAAQTAGGSSSGSTGQQATQTSRAKRTTTTAETDTTAKRKRTTTTVKPRRTTPTTKPKRATTTTKPKPKVTPAPPPVVYTQAQSEAIIRAIWPDNLENKAVAIAKRESNLRANVRNWCCYGLFQIHFNANKKLLAQIGITSPNQLFDPSVNARAALVMYMRSGWGPWGG
jgi:hypothetical protein